MADFYAAVMAALAELGVPVRIHTMPNEIPDAIPFEQDREHAAYDPAAAHALLARARAGRPRLQGVFRAGFVGKCSPVHFFWGSFDLAVTRFSGRAAPPHPGGVPNMPDWVTREAYSHEVSSAGFWPGNAAYPEAVFYSYAYPEPHGFRDAPVRPAAARFDGTLGEFVLPYDAVRDAAPTPTPRCSRSCRAPTRRRRTAAAGIARRWSAPTRDALDPSFPRPAYTGRSPSERREANHGHEARCCTTSTKRSRSSRSS